MSSEHRSEVSARVLDLRRQLTERPFSARLESHHIDTVMRSDDRATSTVDVQVAVEADNDGLFHSEWHTWTFETINEHWLGRGWKVDAISGPDLCGTYLRCSS